MEKVLVATSTTHFNGWLTASSSKARNHGVAIHDLRGMLVLEC